MNSAMEVLGFQEAWRGVATIVASAGVLTYVGVEGVTLTDGGARLPLPDDLAVDALSAAHSSGLRAELLVSNFDAAAGAFDPAAAAALLRSTRNRQAVAASLVLAIRQQGWDGVMIDLESMTGGEIDDVISFAHELRNLLPVGARLDIAVEAAADEGGYRAAGYDLAALAGIVDRITVMTYDQHGTHTEPGPVGALGWQRNVIAAALDQVPSELIDLGVAGYGYAWTPGGAREVSSAEARGLAGAAAVFDDAAGEWTAVLGDGTVLWWADARSFALRVGLARELGLGGVALWSLGLSDPLPAPA